MNKPAFIGKTHAAIIAHKTLTTVVVIACLIGGYGIYHSVASGPGTPQYQVARASMGKIVQTVTGTGQVSAANQLSVASQVSGTIESIDVSVGQQVKAGDLIATIDPTNALNSLNNAKIALAKLTEAPKATDVSDAQDSVTQSYGTAFNAISGLFIDLQTIMPGLNSLYYTPTGFLSEQLLSQLTPAAQNYRTTANMSYDSVNLSYQSLLTEYAALSRQSSTGTISQDLADAYGLAKNVANALTDAQNAVTYISANQQTYQTKNAATAESDVSTWSTSANNDVSNLLSAQSGITSAQNALTNLVTSADPLDVQTSQLSVQEAEQTYEEYFIRAPFDGVIGLIPVNVYGQAGNGTSIATIVGNQKIATLSLDEVDAATVKVGDPVSLTFDAINNFTATGTVSEVDLVGTVSSGVVSYGVKVTIDTADSRINPGMSVNATITTNEIDNVLVVPSATIKTQGNTNYVQTFATLPQTSAAAGRTGSTTARTGRSFASSTAGFASSTVAGGQYGGTGSTTRQFAGGAGGIARSAAVTVTSATPPKNQIVTIGASDGTNTQITGGLTAGAWVVTKTITTTAAPAAAAAPSLLSSLGAGGRAGGGGGFGGGAGGGAARAPAAAAGR